MSGAHDTANLLRWDVMTALIDEGIDLAGTGRDFFDAAVSWAAADDRTWAAFESEEPTKRDIADHLYGITHRTIREQLFDAGRSTSPKGLELGRAMVRCK